MGLVHDFGIIENFSGNMCKYKGYTPEKFSCISIHDDFILPLVEKFQSIPTINPCRGNNLKGELWQGLCYYGVTLIPWNVLPEFIDIFQQENNDVYKPVICLMKKAYTEKKYVIHYGI